MTTAVEAEREQIADANQKLTRLNTELSTTRDQLQAEVDARLQAQRDAASEVSRLEAALTEATTSISAEKSRLQESVESAAREVARLTTELASTKSEESGSKQELDALRLKLREADEKLNQEGLKRDEAVTAADHQVRELKESLDEARLEAGEASERSIEAQNQLKAKTEELVELREVLEQRNQQMEAQSAEARDEISQLQTRLESTESELNEEKTVLQQALAVSEEHETVLRMNIVALEESQKASLAEHETKINEASQKIQQLTQSLLDAEEQLAEQESDVPLDGEVTQLKQELNAAKEKLEIELTRRNSTESAASAQIDELLDELNKLRAESDNKEEQSTLMINTLETRYSALDAEYQNLKQEAERTTAYAETQTQLLQEALSDTEHATKLGDAARKVTQHLKVKIQQLEDEVEHLNRKTEEQAAALSKQTETAENDIPPPDEAATGEPESADELPETPELVLEEPVLEEPALEESVLEEDGEDEPPDTDATIAETEIAGEQEPPVLSLETQVDETGIQSASDEEAEISTASDSFEDQTPDEVIDDKPVISPDEVEWSAIPDDVTTEENAKDETTSDIDSADDITLPPESLFGGTPEDDEEEEEYEFQFDDKPIRSTRPINNHVLHSMIERFVDRLDEHIDSMEMALKDRDYLELVVSCNWVRGEANTLGFEVLSGPISSIELQLRRQKFSQIITHLSELRNMAERIEIKHTATDDAPIQYHVPDHAKNSVIYENFVSQLGSKLLELEVAVSAENFRQMTQICRWIDRYSTKIKFVEVLDAAKEMQTAIDSEEIEEVKNNLHLFIDLYSRIEIVKPAVA